MIDVCISHQSDWIQYKQPIKFLVVKVDGISRFDPDTVQNDHIYSSIKEEEIFIYIYMGFISTFFVG